MRLTLDIKEPCNFFWLRGIRRARIDRCCAKCFIGEAFHEIYEKTHFAKKAHIEFDIPHDDTVKAYYLCGLSRGFIYANNTHVAFNPCAGESILKDTTLIHLEIKGAREIHFQYYIPQPEGEYTEEQRACRNWIFANYFLDGMPL